MDSVSDRAVKVFESRGLNGNEALVQQIKDQAAVLWDCIDSVVIPPGNSEAGRLVSLAKTELEASVMWAVKSISRG